MPCLAIYPHTVVHPDPRNPSLPHRRRLAVAIVEGVPCESEEVSGGAKELSILAGSPLLDLHQTCCVIVPGI